ncbi:hypothetical protein PAMP_021140 [Pampus punctatissimus]
MWYRRKMFLAVIFTALCYKVAAVKQLDKALEAVDDLYDGCKEKALEMVIDSGLLKQELNRSEEFQKAWHYPKCSDLIPGRVKEHSAALWTYENYKEFQNTFNNAVETMGGNVSIYKNNFHFKSLHFLLMNSMKLLPQNECKNVYAISDIKYEAKKGSKVRFGRFTSVQTDTAMIEDIDGPTFLNITTCFFVNLSNFCNTNDDAGIISPTEEFTVVDVKEKQSDDNKYTDIILMHSQLTSLHNCYIISRSPSDVSTKWLVLVLMSFPLFFFNC